MHPFTLGYINNPVLKIYFDAYFLQLQKIARGILSSDLTENREFLFLPDISTTLEGYRGHKISLESTREFLIQEWGYFISGQRDIMFSNAGAVISNTDIHITTIDANPDNQSHNHPDHIKSGVALGWGIIPESDWLDLYAESFGILKSISPGFSSELDQMIHKIIPIGVSKNMHNSASYSSCIGHLYMSYPIDMSLPALAVLEAIIHESNHNKLNLIMKSDPLIENTREEVYYSPYRPDARHIHGIYLGLHALAGVISVFVQAHAAGVYQLNDTWLEKIFVYHMKNALSIRVLEKYGRFTPLGDQIFSEMQSVQRESSALFATFGLSSEFKSRATSAVKSHFSNVQRDYAYLQY